MTDDAAPAHTSDPIRIRALDETGKAVAGFLLEHGADPHRELGLLGWAPVGLSSADRAGDGALVLTFTVSPARALEPGPVEVPTDADLVVEPGERAWLHQRTSAYGVVTSDRGVLLTELSALTSSPGRWTLPGGGLDPGEEPLAGLHREVWEESGQLIEDVVLLEARTSHWIGRAPNRRLEDFHAVRLVYAARCPRPSDPVVHDVGGSTASVRWVAPREVDRYRLGKSFGPHMHRWLHP